MSPLLRGMTWLLVFQCLGEIATHAFALPVPGPVIGMVLFLIVLRARGSVSESAATAADGLARHLSLLFVPAGVGVMLHVSQLAGEWLAIAAALLISTVVAIAAAAATFAFFLGRRSIRQERTGAR